MIKLVVCDLDGTLLDDNKMVTDYNREVLRTLRSRGVKICYASGRDEQMMRVYGDCIGGVDFLLSNNGAMLRDDHGTVIHHSFLMPEDVREILQYLDAHDMTYMMYTADTMYHSENSPRMKKKIRDYESLTEKIGYPVHLDARELKRGSGFSCSDSAKIVAYEDDEEKAGIYRAYLNHLENVHYETTGYGLYGAFCRDVSKKSALLHVMEHMGIGPDEVCVFGDYDNDLSMFECASHRIFMANGSDSLKDKASDLAPSNNEDGVGRYLAGLFGL